MGWVTQFCAARELVGDEPFAVLLGDVIMEGPVPATRALIEIYEATGQGAIHVQEVPREAASITTESSTRAPGNQPRWGDSLLRLNDLVEKPSVDKAPSNLGVSGRYVLPPEVFDYLDETKPGAGGEIQLTDALRALAAKEGLWAHVHPGKNARRRKQNRLSEGDGRTGPAESEIR